MLVSPGPAITRPLLVIKLGGLGDSEKVEFVGCIHMWSEMVWLVVMWVIFAGDESVFVGLTDKTMLKLKG